MVPNHLMIHDLVDPRTLAKIPTWSPRQLATSNHKQFLHRTSWRANLRAGRDSLGDRIGLCPGPTQVTSGQGLAKLRLQKYRHTVTKYRACLSIDFVYKQQPLVQKVATHELIKTQLIKTYLIGRPVTIL